MTENVEGQMNLLDLGISFGRTCREHSVQENRKGQTSKSPSRKSSKSQTPPLPMCLCLRGGRWTKQGYLYDEMGRWSVAWKLHDAQYHGVPQRRKRLCVLADLNGLTAAEILFEPQLERTSESGEPNSIVRYLGRECRPEVLAECQGLQRDSEQSESQRQTIAGDTETGIGESE